MSSPSIRTALSCIVIALSATGASAIDFCGVAVKVDAGGKISVVEVEVTDDDIAFNKETGGTGAEVGQDPEGTIDGSKFSPNGRDPATGMDLVRVDVTDSLGTLLNVLAMRYSLSSDNYYLLSSTQGVDYSSVSSLTLNSVTGNSVTNIFYKTYGLYEKLDPGTPPAGADRYCGKAMRVDRLGNVLEVVDVEVWDDDIAYNNVGGGAAEVSGDPAGTIGGRVFFPNADHPQTEMHLVTVDITDGLGTINNILVMRYEVDGVDYYIASNARGIDYDTVSSAAFVSESTNSITNIFYEAYGLYEKLDPGAPPAGADRYCGRAMRVDRLGNVLEVVDVEVWDDDIAFNNVGGGASEVGGAPVGTIGGRVFFPNADHPQTEMHLVLVNITDGLGTINNALVMRYEVDGVDYYIASNTRGVDYDTVSSAAFVSESTNSITNIFYEAYGLYEKLDPGAPPAGADRYCGKALRVDRLGNVLEVVEVEVWDDDKAYNNVGGGASEVGGDPAGTIGGRVFFPNADHPQTEMDIVDLDVTDGLGTLNTALAMRYRVDGVSYYLVRSSLGVDYATASVAVRNSVSGNSISNIFYEIYGLFRKAPLGTAGVPKSTNVLRVARTGALSVVVLQVWDDDDFFSNLSEGDVEQGLDPYGLIDGRCYLSANAAEGGGTGMRSVELEVSLTGGGTGRGRAIEYTSGGWTYYLPIPLGGWNPKLVASITTIAAANDPPGFTSGTSVTVEENVSTSVPVYTARATDLELEAPVYSISGGADAAYFDIDPVSGALTFIVSPDFENPHDSDGDNTYVVTLSASDGAASGTRTVDIKVTDVVAEYEAWIATFYPGVTDPAIVGRRADPNGDGLSNEFSWFYNLDPSAGIEPAKRPILSVRILAAAEIKVVDPAAAVADGQSYLAVRIRRPKSETIGTAKVVAHEELDDLSSRTANAKRYGPQVDDGFYWIEDYYFAHPTSVAPYAFSRVEVDFN